MSESLPLWQGK